MRGRRWRVRVEFDYTVRICTDDLSFLNRDWPMRYLRFIDPYGACAVGAFSYYKSHSCAALAGTSSAVPGEIKK